MTSLDIIYKCRAVLLLEKEHAKLKKSGGLWGVEVEVDEEDVFKWRVIMSGLKDTMWQGKVLLRFIFTLVPDGNVPLVILCVDFFINLFFVEILSKFIRCVQWNGSNG